MNKSNLGKGIINLVGYFLMFIGANLLFSILKALWGVINMYKNSNTVFQDANSSFTIGAFGGNIPELIIIFSVMFIFGFLVVYLGYFLTHKK